MTLTGWLASRRVAVHVLRLLVLAGVAVCGVLSVMAATRGQDLPAAMLGLAAAVNGYGAAMATLTLRELRSQRRAR